MYTCVHLNIFFGNYLYKAINLSFTHIHIIGTIQSMIYPTNEERWLPVTLTDRGKKIYITRPLNKTHLNFMKLPFLLLYIEFIHIRLCVCEKGRKKKFQCYSKVKNKTIHFPENFLHIYEYDKHTAAYKIYVNTERHTILYRVRL